MSDGAIRKLFAQMNILIEEIAEMKKVVNKASANSVLVLECYHQHGTAIENLQQKIERLNLNCPLMKMETGEFVKVREDE
jgi:hypothetical protein